MAQFTTSEYGKYVSLQNVSASADPASAPDGGVYLFASGTAGSAKLYLQNEGSSSPLDVANLSVDIDGFSALGGTGIAQGDHLLFSDAGTEKKITFSNFEDAIFGNVSGDATIAAGGALTIAAQAVENSMLADDAVGADELAANAVVNASVVDGALKADKFDIDGSTDIGADLVDADLMVVDDGASGTNRKSTFTRVKKYIYSAMSGDATASDSGALTIAADAVEGSMLNDNVISGQTELAHADIASADELMISDGGTLKKVGLDSLRDHYFGQVSGDATIADGGALTIGANAVQTGMVHDDVATELAGDGLSASSGVLAVGVDGSSIETNSDALRVKALGVTNAMLAGSIANAKLSNDSVTIGSTECDLGSTTTVFAGITQLTASAIRVTDLDVVTLNSIAQTEQTLEIADKLIVASLSASSANSAGGGLKIGGGQEVAGHASLLWDHANSALDFNIGGTTEMRLADGVLRPETDNDVDLGASGAEFKDLYISGSANIDMLKMPDVTSGKLLVADGTSYEEVALSGDATLASNGALTIANDAVEQAMIADDAVGADQLASNAVVEASIVDNAVTLAKMAGITRGSVILGDASGDPSLLAKGTSGQFLQSDGTDPSYVSMSGDVASLASGGAVTLAAAQTNITSLLAADIKIGEDDQTKIDFETADEIHFYAANAEQVYVADGVFGPQTDSDVDLGADGVAFKKLFVDDVDLNGQGRIDLDADADTSIRSAADDQIQFELGGSDRFTMAATGMAFGAGASAGGASIGVDGSGNFDGSVVVGVSGTGAGFRAFGAAAGEEMIWSSDNANLSFKYHDGSSQATIMTLGGDATSEYALDVANGSDNINKVRAAAFVTYSDESLKSDVASMSNTALDTVMSLEGVEFTWKDSGERDFGFIAQDVQSVLPKAVHTADDGVQGVDYSRLTSVLVEAVKAQQVQIDDLKKVITNLKK